MSAEVQEQPLSKIDSASAIDDTAPASPTEAKKGHRRTSSTVSGVFNIADLGELGVITAMRFWLTGGVEKEGVELKIAPDTQKLGWKLNTSPSTIDDKDVLKKLLTTPPIKKIDLHFPLGLEVTARNLKGVTIKDALDAIHKQFKKKADDELDAPYLAGFEWDPSECYTRFIVHQKKTGEAPVGGGGKKKKGKKDEDE